MLVNPGLDTDAVQPFPVVDVPKTATVTAAGTELFRTAGPAFDTSWAVGTAVIVNGVTTSLYSSPSDGDHLSLADSVGGGTGLTLEIPEPVKAGQPFPALWGPYYNTLFACGNPLDVGSLYYTKEFDPDSGPFTASVEVTSPSETLMNGCLYDGRCFVFSDLRMFSILPTGNSASPFSTTEIPNGKGLFSRWAFCVGPKIWFLSQDGFYETAGGPPTLISDDIRLMLAQGDQVGLLTNGIIPINILTPASQLRMSYHNGYVFFDYFDVNGAPSSLAYDTVTKGWMQDVFFRADGIPTVGNKGLTCRFSESAQSGDEELKDLLGGTTDGWLYKFGGTSDDGIPIACTIRTPAMNNGDTRAKKQFGDIWCMTWTSQNVSIHLTKSTPHPGQFTPPPCLWRTTSTVLDSSPSLMSLEMRDN